MYRFHVNVHKASLTKEISDGRLDMVVAPGSAKALESITPQEVVSILHIVVTEGTLAHCPVRRSDPGPHRSRDFHIALAVRDNCFGVSRCREPAGHRLRKVQRAKVRSRDSIEGKT
jgi:hypothetical protein